MAYFDFVFDRDIVMAVLDEHIPDGYTATSDTATIADAVIAALEANRG